MHTHTVCQIDHLGASFFQTVPATVTVSPPHLSAHIKAISESCYHIGHALYSTHFPSPPG